jgi:hypothetical protein
MKARDKLSIVFRDGTVMGGFTAPLADEWDVLQDLDAMERKAGVPISHLVRIPAKREKTVEDAAH